MALKNLFAALFLAISGGSRRRRSPGMAMVDVMRLVAFLVASTAQAQTVTGPLSSTTNSIPTFIDASGKRIGSNGTDLMYDPVSKVLVATNGFRTGGNVQANGIGLFNSLLMTNAGFSLLSDTLFPLAQKSGDPTIRNGGGALLFTGTNAAFQGMLSLSARTNVLSINASGELLLDGVAIASTTTVITNNSVVISNLTVLLTTITSNLNFINGNGNKITISNSLTIQTNGALQFQNLPLPSVLVVGTNGNATNATLSGLTLSDANVLTASGGGGGASTWLPVTALTYSGGTNVTMDASGGTNFTLLVTNTVFMAAPNNPPASAGTNTSWTVTFKMNGTGGFAVTWTNLFRGASFQPMTNANAVSSVTISTSTLTNGQYFLDYGVIGL